MVKKPMLVLAFMLVSVGAVRAESWSVAVGGSIAKVEVTQVDGKVFADVQSLLSFLGYSVSINSEGKVIALDNQRKSDAIPDQYDLTLQSLKDIASAAKVGISSVDYTKMVRDAQISMDRFAEKAGAQHPNTKDLRAAFAIYLDASNLWQEGIEKGSRNQINKDENALYLPKQDGVVKALLAKYPEMKNLLEKMFFTKQLNMNRGLSFLWLAAQSKLDQTRKAPDAAVK